MYNRDKLGLIYLDVNGLDSVPMQLISLIFAMRRKSMPNRNETKLFI
jgi:hypothetical protein